MKRTTFLIASCLCLTALAVTQLSPMALLDQTNGFTDQATFEADRHVFQEQESVEEGLGPAYNAQSCGECHQTPRTGGSSQITELRAGHRNRSGEFAPAFNDSLIHDRSIDPLVQERVPDNQEIRAKRLSVNTLGDGYIEAIEDQTLLDIANRQAATTGGAIHGLAIQVPVLEAPPGITRIGRFGWKDQHASLISFAAEAYFKEQGVTNRFFLQEDYAGGKPTTDYDSVADPEDGPDETGLDDVERFARFMRSTNAPPPDPGTASDPNAAAGSRVFERTGCAVCHVSSLKTAPAGTVLNGGTLVVPEALASKVIHPYSDFLLHDIGTGDGIVQNGGPDSARRIRTAPLWGLRMRGRLMHDGDSETYRDAILRHAGEASRVRARYVSLSPAERKQLEMFLGSL